MSTASRIDAHRNRLTSMQQRAAEICLAIKTVQRQTEKGTGLPDPETRLEALHKLLADAEAEMAALQARILQLQQGELGHDRTR